MTVALLCPGAVHLRTLSALSAAHTENGLGLVASQGLPATEVYAVGAAVFVLGVVIALLIGRHSGRRALSQRLTALGTRLGIETPDENANLETALTYLEQVTGAATEAVADSSADAIRLRRSLDTFPQGVVLCDENGAVVYRNARATALMTSRQGDALAAQAVTELLEDAWDTGAAERTLDLYGPPRRTLAVRARLIDDGRRPLGVIAIIEDVSERRRLEEIRRDFVANVSHELKTPMGALGLLAETLVAEPDAEVARRLASRIHTEAFRVSRIIDDLLDLSRIESEEAPPREPVLVNLVIAEAVERVRATAEQRHITITLHETEPPVVVRGDRRQLVSAMHALIENAVTYSYDSSTVVVAATLAPARVGDLGGPRGAGARSSEHAATAAAGITRPAGADGAQEPDSREEHPAGTVSTQPAGTQPAGSEPAGTQPAGPQAASSEPTSPEPAGSVSTELGGSDPVSSQPAGPVSSEPAGSHPGGSVSTQPAGPVGANGERSSVHPPRDTVRLSVADRGVGIPARDLDRIFERFYRVDHGRSRETGGTGLGLSIVRHVASNHQGWVEVESREGEGSTFTLVLPLYTDRH